MKGIFAQIERLITEHGSAEILRERLGLAADQSAALEQKLAECESERDSQQRQVAALKQEVANLKKMVATQTDRPTNFDDNTHKVLRFFFDESADVYVDQVAQRLGLDRPMVEYHFDLLREADFITQTRMGVEGLRGGSSPPMYGITAKGRKYVVKNGI